ncbi:6-carboxytetrahydropterin synthase QueD [Alkalihalobacillus hemicellulosilyticus]|uniref:6-carboxy-5,6,7,8-tetrahydropterin synthase n=1 Tax=Halalkalibacter hemicellulosilyticusJCM 9152 TaxID=1236971 RepID=W4QGB4_9BACI|nr:6-carboxytetrahydropterin synthase QueD [Halalkalibacter hemicellulosilyticus]GAE30942.1 queuosine biosynthesis QueD [Halalkalibacter hemicellulosilyticusJCM 9152]
MLQQFYPQVPHSYRYELNKDMNLSAAHFIPDEKAGVCKNMHGHTYFINVTIAGDQLDELGFLIDFKQIKDLVHKRYDHTLLNDHNEYKEIFPTTERVAEQIWKTIHEKLQSLPHQPKCLQVLVRETPTSYVVYRPKPEELL